jgi:cation transport ATPase
MSRPLTNDRGLAVACALVFTILFGVAALGLAPALASVVLAVIGMAISLVTVIITARRARAARRR